MLGSHQESQQAPESALSRILVLGDPVVFAYDFFRFYVLIRRAFSGIKRGSLGRQATVVSNYTHVKFEPIIDETGKKRLLTISERQFYPRIAAYTAQIINSINTVINKKGLLHKGNLKSVLVQVKIP